MWSIPRCLFLTSWKLILFGVLSINFYIPFFMSPSRAFVPHVLLISTFNSVYFDIFFVILTKVLHLDGMTMSIMMYSLLVLFFMMIFCLFVLMSLSVWKGMFHKTVILSLSRLMFKSFVSFHEFVFPTDFKCR